MGERLHDALVWAGLTVREPRPAPAAKGQRAFEPVVLHERVTERAPVHVDVDEFHRGHDTTRPVRRLRAWHDEPGLVRHDDRLRTVSQP